MATAANMAHTQRRKKGARSLLDRRKNRERLRFQDNKENIRASIYPPIMSLPKQWQVHADGDTTMKYFKIIHGAVVSQVGLSVIIHLDGSWDVFTGETKVNPAGSALSRIPSCMPSADVALDLIHAVDSTPICLGNPEEKFIDVCKSKGGSIKGERGFGQSVEYLDNSRVNACTVRSTKCDILCANRCKPCTSLRSSLRSATCRQQNAGDNPTEVDSHTTYCNMSTEQKDARLKNLHYNLKLSRQQNKGLQAKIAKLIEKESLSLQDEDATDISTVMKDVQSLVEANFPTNTPQRVFWDQQVLFNGLKDKR